jgi:hypothetical protein
MEATSGANSDDSRINGPTGNPTISISHAGAGHRRSTEYEHIGGYGAPGMDRTASQYGGGMQGNFYGGTPMNASSDLDPALVRNIVERLLDAAPVEPPIMAFAQAVAGTSGKPALRLAERGRNYPHRPLL